MGFFLNDVKQAPKPAADKVRVYSRNVHIPIHSMQELGCRACPRDKDSSIKSPKMNPSGPDVANIYVLHAAPSVEDDEADEYGRSPSGAMVMRKLRRLGVQALQHSIVRCRLPDGRSQVPLVEESACCRGYVEAEIERAAPRVVIGVGDEVLRWATGIEGKNSSAMNFRGKPISAKFGKHVCWFVPVLFPNFAYKERTNWVSEYEYALEHDLAVAKRLADEHSTPLWFEGPYDKGLQLITGTEAGDLQRLEDILHRLLREPSVALDYETEGLRPWHRADPHIWEASAATFDYGVAFAVDHPDGWGTETRMRQVRGMLGDFIMQSGTKIAHNLGFEMEWSNYFYGDRVLRMTDWADTMAQAHTLDERAGTKGLGRLTRVHFGFDVKAQSNIDVKSLLKYPIRQTLQYNGMDSKWTHLLYHHQQPMVEELKQYVWEYERKVRLAPTLVLSQAKGVPIDMDFVLDYQAELKTRARNIAAQIQRMPEVKKYEQQIGRFSPTAPEDVLRLMKDVCKRPEVKTTDPKTGAVRCTTEEEALELIPASVVPSAPLIIEHRGLEKLTGTYLAPLSSGNVIAPQDGRVHTQYGSMVAVTGRLNSEDPNLQNIPIRTAEGKRIRHAFYADEDQWIAALDYGQIEARVIAMASEDKNLCKHLWTAYDIHGYWAERFVKRYPKIKDWVVSQFKIDWDEKGHKTLRQEAKNKWVFPQFFGAGYQNCAADLHIPVDVAEELADEFWSEFRGVLKWQEKLIRGFEKNLYVETLTGRRRRGPMNKNEIINSPVQGTAADIVTAAMSDLSELSQEEDDPELQPNLNIHDDLTFWLADASVDAKIPRIAKVMCAHRFDFMIVPINVEVKLGARWDEMSEIAVYRSEDLYNLTNPFK